MSYGQRRSRAWLVLNDHRNAKACPAHCASGAPAPTEETQVFITRSQQAATRRRNVLTGSLAAGLAIALAGLAYWQRGIAAEQRSIAQRNEAQAKIERDNATSNFKLAQKAAESLVFDIAQGPIGRGREAVREGQVLARIRDKDLGLGRLTKLRGGGVCGSIWHQCLPTNYTSPYSKPPTDRTFQNGHSCLAPFVHSFSNDRSSARIRNGVNVTSSGDVQCTIVCPT